MPDRRRVVVAGASGLIGRALVASLRADGVPVVRLVRRRAAAADEAEWLTGAPLDPSVLDGARAVVGLNGASIGRLPWTARRRSTLLWSRLTPTRVLAAAVRRLGSHAPVLVSASAVGFYGSVPHRPLAEDARCGDTFLARLCEDWEHAARDAGPHARVALARTAPVIHPDGILAPLVRLTRAGAAGPLGSGTQVWPWISLDDEVRALRHLIDTDLEGPVNLAAPARTTANDLGFALAVRLNRPYLLRTPAWALRLAAGREAADALLLSDAHVVPAVLHASGFRFAHTDADEAVGAALGQKAARSDASSRSD